MRCPALIWVLLSRPPLICLLLALGGCAGENAPGNGEIRRGRLPDQRTDAGLLDGPSDDALVDAGRPADGSAPALPVPPSRTTWFIIRSDAYSDGVRARLEPPHRRVETRLDTFLSAPKSVKALVEWTGPDSDSDRLLSELLRTGRAAAVFYEASDRPGAQSTADIQYIAAHHFPSPTYLQLDGGPLLVLGGSDPAKGLDSAQQALDAVGQQATLLVQPPAASPYVVEGADGVMAPWRAGSAAEGGPDTGRSAAQLRALRQASVEAGLIWVPLSGPSRNGRVINREGIAEPPSPGAFDRSLLLARISSANSPAIAVDGIGRWRDDGQLDPVRGRATGDPFSLTTGISYPATDGRVGQAASLLSPASAPPDDLGQSPPLILLSPNDGPRLSVLDFDEAGVHLETLDDREGRLEVLTDGRPFIMPPNRALTYRRSTPRAYLDLVFEDGRRLGSPPNAALSVEIDLRPFTGRRVEALTVVFTPDSPEASRVSVSPPTLSRTP